MLTVGDVRAAMAGFGPQLLPRQPDMKKAAVAAVLRDGGDGAELLFIHRAEHPHDPWSGHMAFPGGRMSGGDRDELAAAIRETREELGLDLAAEGEAIGRLSDVAAVSKGRPLSLVIVPFVFTIRGEPRLVLNHEVADFVWVPLAFLADHGNRSTVEWRLGGMTIPLPCYRFRDKLIWGLTFGMVDELLSILAS